MNGRATFYAVQLRVGGFYQHYGASLSLEGNEFFI